MEIATISATASEPSHCQVFLTFPNLGCAKGYGGEQISLAIQSGSTNNFRNAGYAKIHTNKTYVGGYVRQYGNLSFSRVLGAGHEGEPHLKEPRWHVIVRLTFVFR